MDLQDHSVQLGSGEVLVARVCVASGHSEPHGGLFSTCGGQCIITATLEGIGFVVVRDVVWITVHTAGDCFGREATFDPVLFLADLIVCTAPCGTMGLSVAHALTPLGATFIGEHHSFLDLWGEIMHVVVVTAITAAASTPKVEQKAFIWIPTTMGLQKSEDIDRVFQSMDCI